MATRREQRLKKQQKGRRGRRKWSTARKVVVGVVAALVCVAGVGVTYAATKMNEIQTEDIPVENIEASEQAVESAEGYTSFVVFGVDSRVDNLEGSRSDCIIICSLNNATKEVKMLSVLRDSFLDIGGGDLQKCNAAYSYGGPEQALNMLNRNLDLYLTDYVTVGFGAIANAIDLLGGVEIDVQENEIKYINKYQKEVAKSANKEIVEVTEPGVQMLNGVQATSYARVRRTTGGDFTRAQRQRTVIKAMVDQVQKSDLVTLNSLIDEIFPSIKTSFSLTEILAYAADFAKYTIGETTGFPFEVASRTYDDVGSVDIPLTLDSNVVELHKFLYDEDDYTPSDTVMEISQMIQERVGDIAIEAHQTADDGTSMDEIYQWTAQEQRSSDYESDDEDVYDDEGADSGTETSSDSGGAGEQPVFH